MKTRFLALLAAMAVGSAAVLIYASQSRPSGASASLDGAGDCSACELSAAKPMPAVAASLSATDECCAADAAKPVVATIDAAGCPFAAGDTTAALVADGEPAKTADSACCATVAAPATGVAAQVEK